MAGTIVRMLRTQDQDTVVSMESGLDGRNNQTSSSEKIDPIFWVSMESGLDGRNNTNGKPTDRPGS